MRRALRFLLMAALLTAAIACATGWQSLTLLEGAETESEAVQILDGALSLVHALAGHLTVALAGLVAAMAFVLGLQGVLDAGGRRVLSAALLALAPTITWLALCVEFGDGVDDAMVSTGLLAAELARVESEHALVHALGLVASLVATALITWRLAAGSHDEVARAYRRKSPAGPERKKEPGGAGAKKRARRGRARARLRDEPQSSIRSPGPSRLPACWPGHV